MPTNKKAIPSIRPFLFQPRSGRGVGVDGHWMAPHFKGRAGKGRRIGVAVMMASASSSAAAAAASGAGGGFFVGPGGEQADPHPPPGVLGIPKKTTDSKNKIISRENYFSPGGGRWDHAGPALRRVREHRTRKEAWAGYGGHGGGRRSGGAGGAERPGGRGRGVGQARARANWCFFGGRNIGANPMGEFGGGGRSGEVRRGHRQSMKQNKTQSEPRILEHVLGYGPTHSASSLVR